MASPGVTHLHEPRITHLSPAGTEDFQLIPLKSPSHLIPAGSNLDVEMFFPNHRGHKLSLFFLSIPAGLKTTLLKSSATKRGNLTQIPPPSKAKLGDVFLPPPPHQETFATLNPPSSLSFCPTQIRASRLAGF